MTRRPFAVTDFSPEAIRAMVEAKCWRDLELVHDECLRVLYRLNASKQTRPAEAKRLKVAMAAQLLELVRTPGAFLPEKSRHGLHQRQYMVWEMIATKLRPQAAILIAKSWAMDKRTVIRETGSRMLASFGASSELRTILDRMKDPDNSVGQQTMWGVGIGIKGKAFSTAAQRTLLVALRDIVSGQRKYSGLDHVYTWVAAVNVLLDIDGDDAVRFLCSDKVLRLGNPVMREALLQIDIEIREGPKDRRSLMAKAANPRSLWTIYEAWTSGQVIRSRKKHWAGCDDDQIAGLLLALGSVADPARTRTELASLATSRRPLSESFEWGAETARIILSGPRKASPSKRRRV